MNKILEDLMKPDAQRAIDIFFSITGILMLLTAIILFVFSCSSPNEPIRVESPLLSPVFRPIIVLDEPDLTLYALVFNVLIETEEPLQNLQLILHVFANDTIVSKTIGYPVSVDRDQISYAYDDPFPYIKMARVDSIAWGYVTSDLFDTRKVGGGHWNLTTSFEVNRSMRQKIIIKEFNGKFNKPDDY